MPNLQPDDDNEDLNQAFVADQPGSPKTSYSTSDDDYFWGTPEKSQAVVDDRSAQSAAALAALRQITDKPIDNYTMQPSWNLGSGVLGLHDPRDKSIKYRSALNGGDLRNTMLHEMMHATGFDHTNNPADVMKPTLDLPDEDLIKKFLTAQGRNPAEMRDQQLAFTVEHGNDLETRKHLFDQDLNNRYKIGNEQDAKYQRAPDVGQPSTFDKLKGLVGIQDKSRDNDDEPFTPAERASLMNYVYADKKKPAQ